MKTINTSSLKDDIVFKNKDEIKFNNVIYKIVELDSSNLAKLSLNLAYYKEAGYKNFALVYNFKKCKVPFKFVLKKIKLENIFKFVRDSGFSFLFIGFPRCIFERFILKPNLRWYFEKNILFYDKLSLFNSENFIFSEECDICAFRSKCSGINKIYVKNFGVKEFNPIILNNELFYLNSRSLLKKFSNKSVVKFGKEVLKDFKSERLYKRKRFLFVDSFPKSLEESSVERFLYLVYNRSEDFDKFYKFLGKFFNSDFLDNLKSFLMKSDELGLSFGLMGNGALRKSFYFSLRDFSIDEIRSISKLFNLEIFYEKSPIGIGVDFWDGFISFKVFYRRASISQLELKNFVKEFSFEDKRSFLKFCNSLLKPLSDVFLCYKYSGSKLVSKRIDVSLESNNFRISQFYTLFGIPISFFEGKELQFFSFEIKGGSKEKLNFYYTLSIPDEEEEVEEDDFVENDSK